MPFWSSLYIINVGLLILVHAALASMWNLLAGYSGMVSLGQQMFIGIGGYTLAVLSLFYGVPIFLSVLIGGMTSVLLAVFISLPIFRMKGVHFAIGTWVIAEALGICFSNWGYVKYGMGLFIKPAYSLTVSTVYYAALIVCIISVALVYILLRSNIGLALMAIVTGAAAGILYLNTIFIQPFEAFGIGWTVKLLFIVIIGGVGTIEGPIVGAIIFVLLHQLLSGYVGYNLIILGTITIAVIFFVPRGIMGTLLRNFDIGLFPIRHQ
jgi:branched-chain amino acid transport system permease protein